MSSLQACMTLLLISYCIIKYSKLDISIDLVEGLPNSFGEDVIFVVVNRLTTYSYYIALSHY